MRELQYLRCNIPFNTICFGNSYGLYRELVRGILQAAPICNIVFELNATILVAVYKSLFDVLHQIFVVAGNMKRLHVEFPRLLIDARIQIVLPEE
uniref:RNase H domain-containing protein n=2 Tax=Bursaphelenchus xylophilus TaxID=6326 RepID=A0A1I7SMZ6_BURXY